MQVGVSDFIYSLYFFQILKYHIFLKEKLNLHGVGVFAQRPGNIIYMSFLKNTFFCSSAAKLNATLASNKACIYRSCNFIYRNHSVSNAYKYLFTLNTDLFLFLFFPI